MSPDRSPSPAGEGGPVASWREPAAILATMDGGRLAPSRREPALDDLMAAQAIQDRVIALRRARGETPAGYKIGFTNRTIWPLYGVHHPIWGPVYDTTVTHAPSGTASVVAGRFAQPRAEPEIVFGLRLAPASDRPADLAAAIDWYAHGFEIVQCPYPNWRQTAAEAVAAQSLHAALFVGARRPLAELADPVTDLAGLRLRLYEGGRPVATGVGADVLDSPLLALGHLVRELARHGRALRAGDVVTTGTLTDAQPLTPGQCWTTELEPLPVAGFTLSVL